MSRRRPLPSALMTNRPPRRNAIVPERPATSARLAVAPTRTAATTPHNRSDALRTRIVAACTNRTLRQSVASQVPSPNTGLAVQRYGCGKCAAPEFLTPNSTSASSTPFAPIERVGTTTSAVVVALRTTVRKVRCVRLCCHVASTRLAVVRRDADSVMVERCRICRRVRVTGSGPSAGWVRERARRFFAMRQEAFERAGLPPYRR